MSSAFFYAKQLHILQRAAVRMELPADAEKWSSLLRNVTSAYRTRFMQRDGTFSDNADGGGTQAMMGSQSLALVFPDEALLSAAERQVVGAALVTNVEAHGNHPYAGELSLTYLFNGLAEQGRTDLVVAMVSNTDQPGWGYMVQQGATTMYESWYTDRYSSIGSRFHDMFIGPYLFFFEGLGGLKQQTDTVGWKRLRIVPQAYDLWSEPLGEVRVLAASWGGNCGNPTSHEDMTQVVQIACVGKKECAVLIPNNSLCDDKLPTPPPPPPGPRPPPSPVCTVNCKLLPMPSMSFFEGSWTQDFKNITTEAECKAACLQSDSCVQITWMVRPQMPCSKYTSVSGEVGKIAGVSGFLKCFSNISSTQECNTVPLPPPPPPPPPPRPKDRRVYRVSYQCKPDGATRSAVLGPDKGSPEHDGAGISFTEAAGRMMHLDCKPRAAPLSFVNTETVTYQGQVSSSWQVFLRANNTSLCGVTDVNTYTGSLHPTSGAAGVLPHAFGHAIAEPASLSLRCTKGLISGVVFASFGQPTGTCGNLSVNAHCHSVNTTAVVRDLCVGKSACQISATSQQFGPDPCPVRTHAIPTTMISRDLCESLFMIAAVRS